MTVLQTDQAEMVDGCVVQRARARTQYVPSFQECESALAPQVDSSPSQSNWYSTG